VWHRARSAADDVHRALIRGCGSSRPLFVSVLRVHACAMDLIAQISLAAGLAWGSGLRLYAVLFLAGVLQRYGYLELPGQLELLANPWVISASGLMLVGEFFADKVPLVDSAWDALQTFVRIPGGILLAWGVFADQGPALQLAAAVLGGTIVSGTHLGKSGSRALINHSPEPFSNAGASFAEDGLLLLGLWLAISHPWLFLALLLLFMLLIAWLLPKLWRLMRETWRRLRPAAKEPAGG
jgi:hypothetical protein